MQLIVVWSEGRRLDSSASGYKPVAGFCEHGGDEPPGSIKDGEFLYKFGGSTEEYHRKRLGLQNQNIQSTMLSKRDSQIKISSFFCVDV
jgi:hypothetical protein